MNCDSYYSDRVIFLRTPLNEFIKNINEINNSNICFINNNSIK